METPVGGARDGDFTTCWREGAVRMTWERLPKRPDQSCLDAGCAWGVELPLSCNPNDGVKSWTDIDSQTISSHKPLYPSVKFVAADRLAPGTLSGSLTSFMHSMLSCISDQ